MSTNYVSSHSNSGRGPLSWNLKWAFRMSICLSVLFQIFVLYRFMGPVRPNLANGILEWRGFKLKWTFTKSKILLQNHWANFNHIWMKKILWWRRFKFGLKKGHTFFQREDDNGIVKIYWQHSKIFARTTVIISTKLGKKGIKVYSNEGPRTPFPKGR